MIDVMREAGCFRAAVPREFGGDRLDTPGRAAIYENVASGYLAAALILTQHDGACELLAGCQNRELAERVLTDVAAGRVLATVGISQLTTSRQGGSTPALAASAAKGTGGYRLDGVMPWVTSAPYADCIVTGAVLEDGMQILAYVPADAPGLTIEPPIEFCALTDSHTCQVRCDGVVVPPERLMRPPCSEALARRSPIKSLTVSMVGIGVARALVDAMNGMDSMDGMDGTDVAGPAGRGDGRHPRQRPAGPGDGAHLRQQPATPADGPPPRRRLAAQPPELQPFAELARRRFEETRRRLLDAAAGLERSEAEVPAMTLRAEVNALVQKLAATYLTLAKGSGYVSSHVAQRLLREAAFFLVWSAPTQVQAQTLRRVWT